MSIMKTFKSKIERKSQLRPFSLRVVEQKIERDFRSVKSEIQLFSIDHDEHVMSTILLKAVFLFKNQYQIFDDEFVEHFEFVFREIDMLEPDSCRTFVLDAFLSLKTFFLVLHLSTLHHESIVESSASQSSFTEEKRQHQDIIIETLRLGLKRIDDQCLVRNEHIVAIDDPERQK